MNKRRTNGAAVRLPNRLAAVWLALLGGLIPGCQELSAPDLDRCYAAYRAQMLSEPSPPATSPGRADWLVHAAAQTTRPEDRAALLTRPESDEPPSPEALFEQIPDPEDAETVFERRRAHLAETQAEARVLAALDRQHEKARGYLAQLRRPRQRHMTLSEAVQRALDNNYSIRIDSISPAISRAQLVEAEAVFDAVFFLDSSYRKIDQPSASQLAPTGSDTRMLSGGIRKLLPTGMQVQTSLDVTRQFLDNFQFQSLNPEYTSSFVTQFTQPLLRGFGLDYNRAQINISRLEQRIAEERFIQTARETLFRVEQAYWQLAQTRREVMILATSVAQNYVTHKNTEERLKLDATLIEYNNSLSRWKSREVEFQDAVRRVREAEDALKNLLNDPELRLSDEIEIIPNEPLFVGPLAVDQFAEVRTALDNRNEIRQAKLRIDQARIRTMAAKNETLPQLDLSFSYTGEGMGSTADNAFDSLGTSRYQSYTVAATFSYPIGNRQREAAWQRARLSERQAIIALNQTADSVVQEVNTAVRVLTVRYQNIPTQLISVQAAILNLASLQARTQRIDPSFLETELAAVENLNNARVTLLQILIQYNIAITALENAKGTLLEYNNVVVRDHTPGK